MLASIITGSEGMVDFAWSRDDELDGALILSGEEDHIAKGRYCFQTTYLNECYSEYFLHCGNNFKLIWLLRNPRSVVYSLLHNWKRFALNELFQGCGISLLSNDLHRRYDRFGLLAVNRLTRACLSYNAKISQVNDIANTLGPDMVMVVDYDDLVINKQVMLPEIYNFINLPYKSEYADEIRESSLKKAEKLSSRERVMIDEVCMPVYEKLKKCL